MKGKNLQEMTREELLKQQKTLSGVTGLLAGMLTVLFIIGIFLAVKQGMYAFIPIPLALLPIVLVNFSIMSKIKKELNSRNDMI